MRTNAVLNATELAKSSFRNPVPATPREPEPTYGCNCDRWGHPCPGCVERNLQPKAEGSGSVHLPKRTVAKPKPIEVKVQ